MQPERADMSAAKRKAAIAAIMLTTFLGGVAASRLMPLDVVLVASIGMWLIWSCEAIGHAIIALRQGPSQ